MHETTFNEVHDAEAQSHFQSVIIGSTGAADRTCASPLQANDRIGTDSQNNLLRTFDRLNPTLEGLHLDPCPCFGSMKPHGLDIIRQGYTFKKETLALQFEIAKVCLTIVVYLL